LLLSICEHCRLSLHRQHYSQCLTHRQTDHTHTHYTPLYNGYINCFSVTVTVTEALVLRLLLEDRGCNTESIRILVPVWCRQNETKMFSDHDETSPSIAAVSAPSVACFMLAVQQQKRLCRQFVDVSSA